MGDGVLYRRRDKFNWFERKIALLFAGIMGANGWTFLAIIFMFIAAFLVINRLFILAALFFIISAFFDVVDGAVARSLGRATSKGAYLDTIVDRYVEAIMIIALFFLGLPEFIFSAQLWLFLFLFGAIMTSYAKAAALEKKVVSDELGHGVLERSERMIILFIGIILASVSMLYLTYIIVLLAILSNITALQRVWIAMKNV